MGNPNVSATRDPGRKAWRTLRGKIIKPKPALPVQFGHGGIDRDHFEIKFFAEAQQRIVRTHARVLASELRPYCKRLVEHFRASGQAGSGYNQVIDRAIHSGIVSRAKPHRSKIQSRMFQVTPIPAFRDNYIWAIHDDNNAIVVDPGDAAPVLDFLRERKLELVTILITHHHNDHTGGNQDLLARYPVPVYGPASEAIDTLTTRLKENDTVTLPAFDLTFTVLDIPGHTAGHIAYVGHGMVFCGDTLFACGCGRLFEGTPAQMYASLGKLAALPGDTQVYCAHEYTLANIAFARVVEPDNEALVQREFAEREKRGRNLPTVPSSIALERATNPFMRSEIPAVVAAANKRSHSLHLTPIGVLATIRDWKNSF